jgi:hypothetical protein
MTNPKIGDFAPGVNADPHVAQSQSITGVGFQPDFLTFLSIDGNTTGGKGPGKEPTSQRIAPPSSIRTARRPQGLAARW